MNELIDLYDRAIIKAGYDEKERLKIERNEFLRELIWNVMTAENR